VRYKDLCFSVLIIAITKNKVNVKYITKNNITDAGDVFLATKNQMNASISSRRNLRLTETRLCIAWLPGSFDSPLIKTIMHSNARRVKIMDRSARSPKVNETKNL
jgi:hypothetical protein